MRRGRVLDVVFLVGVVLKGLDGLVELIAAVPLLLLTHGQLAVVARVVTAPELEEDPHDLISHLILHSAAATTSGTLLFAAVYLIVHGVVKVAVVVALILGARRIYPWAIGVLTAFALFQVAEMIVRPSFGIAALTLLDVVVIALTWREWRQRRTFRQTLRAALLGARRRSRPASG